MEKEKDNIHVKMVKSKSPKRIRGVKDNNIKVEKLDENIHIKLAKSKSPKRIKEVNDKNNKSELEENISAKDREALFKKLSPAESLARLKETREKYRAVKIEKQKKDIPDNPIPGPYKERMIFIRNLLYNETIIRYLLSAPPKSASTYDETAKYFATCSKEPVEVASLIYLWICNNIAYDKSGLINGEYKNISECTPERTFRLGLGICSGYAELFDAMCRSAGLKSEIVIGHAKHHNHLPKTKLTEKDGHAWNTVKLYEVDFLIDTCWGAGYVDSDNKFNRRLNAYYFLTPPEIFIDTHRPLDASKQMIPKPFSMTMFEICRVVNYQNFYQKVIERDIKLYTHFSPLIHIDNDTIQIKLGLPNIGYAVEVKMGQTKIENFNFNYDASLCELTVDIIFPSNGNYSVCIFELDSANMNERKYTSLIDYKVNVEIKKDRTKKPEESSPIINVSSRKYIGVQSRIKNLMNYKSNKSLSKENSRQKKDNMTLENDPGTVNQPKKCYDNENAYLFEPKIKILKKGTPIKFKIKVKNSENVAVLDYKTWNYLKTKGDDIWEGTVTIKSDFVTICSQKSSSLYTEVYEFKVK